MPPYGVPSLLDRGYALWHHKQAGTLAATTLQVFVAISPHGAGPFIGVGPPRVTRPYPRGSLCPLLYLVLCASEGKEIHRNRRIHPTAWKRHKLGAP